VKISLKIGFGLGLVALAIGAFLFLDAPAIHATSAIQEGVNAARGNAQPASLFGVDGIFTTVTNTLLFVVGVLSVLMIIIGGLRYVVSGGNSAAVTSAKNTILYALVGLIVAFLAYAAVNFLLNTLSLDGIGGTNV